MEYVAAEEVGLSSARLNRIRPVMQSLVDQQRFSGLVTLIARRGKIAYLEPFGMADAEAGWPMRPDTLFRIFSMTKPVTSVAVLMLYEEGCFDLFVPVASFIPAFAETKVVADDANGQPGLVNLTRPVTIWDLLTHTSGLTYAFQERTPAIVKQMYEQANPFEGGITLEEMAQRLAIAPLCHQPGSGWTYGSSHDVLARVVEVVSGTPFDAFLQQRMFEPLGMADTSFCVTPQNLPRVAAVYSKATDNGLTRTSPEGNDDVVCPRFPRGGVGLISTATDYLRFAQMLLNGGAFNGAWLLGRKTVELMTMNHLPPACLPVEIGLATTREGHYSDGYGYGLGVQVLMDVARSGVPGSAGTYSWAGVFNTFFWVDPREELIGMVLTQTLPFYHFPLDRSLMVLAYQAIVD